MPIEIKNVSYVYMAGSPFEAAAIQDVTLTITDGELLGLIGHTGSGKSTLVQHLNGLLKPTSGHILVDGVDITQKGVSLREIRQKVGLAFQYAEYQLFEETVAKDIAFGPKNLGLSQPEIDDRVNQAMKQAGVPDELRDRSPFELSGGQKRRVAIAGVLALSPSTLVLDEPTAGLDPRAREDILTMVESLKQQGTTLVLVSHSMDDMARLADRIAVMNSGYLEMVDVPARIFEKAQALQAMGLGVPEAVALADALRAKGFSIPMDCYRMPEVRDAIIQSLGGRHAHV